MAGIRASIKADFKPMKGYAAFVKNARRANTQIMTQTINKHQARYLQPMRNLNPGASQHGAKRGAWSTNTAADDRARRWWWANVKDGTVPADPKTGAYIRQGTLAQAWELMVRGDRLSLENTSDAAAYVYSFAKSPRARGGRPNPGHIRTGWPQTQRETGLRVLDTVLQDVQAAYSKSIAASVASGNFQVVVP